MKRIGLLMVCAGILATSCSKYDPSQLQARIDNADEQIAELEALAVQISNDISGLSTILEEAQAGNLITSCTPIDEGKGYVITFSDGQSVTVTNGKDGIDGTNGKDSSGDGHSPQLSVKTDHTGQYCWTVDGEYLTDESGNHIYVTLDATQGRDGVVPMLRVVDGMWQVSYTGGEVWIDLGQTSAGSPYLFKDVQADGGLVHFTLSDGSSFSLYRLVDPSLAIKGWENLRVIPNRSMTVGYTVEGASPFTTVGAVANHGLSAYVKAGEELGKGVVEIQMPAELTDGDVLVTADNGYGRLSIKKISIAEGTLAVCDIEPVDGMDPFTW